MNESTVVRAAGLTRRFGEVTAVDALDLEVKRGEIFGLVGPDGAGKTTTLRVLCGLMDPTAGEARVAGFDVTRQSDSIKDHIGYMAQRFGLYTDLSVDENMSFYADLFGIPRAEREALLPRLLEMTRMAQFRNRAAGKLSGGMKQKLALMCTLLHRPEILFLDEPTTGVDPVSRRDFWAILYQLVKDGMTVVVTTAYLDEAERCNRVGLMNQGKLIRCDTPEAIKTRFEYPCYEVQSAIPRAAIEALRGLPGVVSVEPAGAALHLFLAPGLTSVDSLRRSVAATGLQEPGFRQIEPSLEDVFIALVRAADLGPSGNGGNP
jgi:ABC-2 type transport system ATP-binding protein